MTNWNRAKAVVGKSIICYKAVSLNAVQDKAFLTSLFYGFEYTLGETYTETDFPEALKGWTVNNAFHAYILEGSAISQSLCDRNHTVMLECEIPEGALYYVSSGEAEICSNKIKALRWKFGFEEEWRTEMPTLDMVAPQWYNNGRENWIDAIKKLKETYDNNHE